MITRMNGARLKILVARHSAFYSPLIATFAAGFLKEQGLEPEYGVLPPGDTSREAISSGRAHIVQSAVSSSWGPMEKGERNLPLHFAQINTRDGFFLVAREPDPDFHVRKLEGRSVLADHALQPLTMLRFAVAQNGGAWNRLDLIDARSPEAIDKTFREGRADYAHLQGPAPQQIERDGKGFIVASVGALMPPVAFSSLVASREFLQTPEARAFLAAYRKARSWVRSAAPDVVAREEHGFFPAVSIEALSASIAAYQRLGCWAGDPVIPRHLYDQALLVFSRGGCISRLHAYEEVVTTPPVVLPF